MSDTNTISATNTIYIVSREKLIKFIEDYIPDDAQFELAVLYEVMRRFATPVGDEAVPIIHEKCDPILNEKTQAFAEEIEGFEPFNVGIDLYNQAKRGRR